MLKITADNFHKKTTAVIITVVFCVLIISALLAVCGNVDAALTDANVKAMETKLSQLVSQKKSISAKIATAKNNKAEATEYKYYLDQQVNLTNDELTTINELLAELDTQISNKETEILQTSEAITTQYENFKSVMRLTYEEGDASYLQMILGAEDFFDFLVRVERISSLMDYCSTLMNKLKESKTQLENAKSVLEESKASQVSYKNELSARKRELDNLQSENESYLNSITADISSFQATYESYAKAEKEVDAQLEKYLKDLQAKENSEYIGGDFRWPLSSSWKNISSGYGYRTLNGNYEFHGGIDIPASQGTPIYASNDGTVVTATFHYSYGNYVLINHGGGMATLYAHASKLAVSAGDKVTKGQVIAYVGTTGYSFGCHVHFEVRKNGTRVNPLKYVSKP